VLGRTDRPYIKEYDEETNLRCVLMLDCSGSMGYGSKHGSKFDYAGKLVASLAYLTLGQTETVGLATFGRKLDYWLPPHSGPQQLSRVIDALERAAPKGESAIGYAMHQVAERLERRSLIIVISDFFSPITKLREGMAHLRHDRHEVITLRVLDPDEIEFPFRNWSKFRGMEGEKPQLCESALIRKVYLENFRRHSREFEESCRAMGAEHHSFVTEKPLLDSLTFFLHRRAMMMG
jgi:uncharacterized protein (DUF58 family)